MVGIKKPFWKVGTGLADWESSERGSAAQLLLRKGRLGEEWVRASRAEL